MNRESVLSELAVRLIVLCLTAVIVVAFLPIILSISEAFFTHAGVGFINKGNWMGKVTWLIASAWLIIVELAFLPSLYTAFRDRKQEELLSSLGVCIILLGFPFVSVGLTYFLLGSMVTTRLALLISAVVVGPCAFLLVKDLLPGKLGTQAENVVRGRQEARPEELENLLPMREEESPYFGGLYLPKDQVTGHFCFLGANKSGKSLSIEMLMESVLHSVGETPESRALIYDNKGDLVPVVKGLGIPYKILNPFDDRSYAWDISADCTNPGLAQEFAKILVKGQEGNNRFFYDAAQQIVRGILTYYVLHKEQWDLYDVCKETRNPERIKELLQTFPLGQDIYATYLNGVKSGPEVISTLRSQIGQLETIAAAWRYLRNKNGSISLKEWVRDKFENPGENYALILGSSNEYADSMRIINQLVIGRIVKLIGAKEEPKNRLHVGRTWFFLDEVLALGKLEGLDELLFNLNSKGVSAVFGVQGKSGLSALYGVEKARLIVDQLKHWAVFKCGPEDAEWVSRSLFGDREVKEYPQSITVSDDRVSVTTPETTATRRAVLPADIQSLPEPTIERGLTGYYLSPAVDKLWTVTIPGDVVQGKRPARDPLEPKLVPTPDEHLQPAYWSEGQDDAQPPSTENEQTEHEQPPVSGEGWFPQINGEDEDEY